MPNNYINTFNNTMSRMGGEPLRIAQVLKVKYPDENPDLSNIPLYDLLAWDENGATFKIENARKLEDLSSTNDLAETILDVNEVAFEGDIGLTNPPRNKNGSYVLVGLINGNRKNAVILGGLPHPRSQSEMTKEKGKQRYKEYNGLRYSINKAGELEVTFKGAKNPDGTPVVENQIPIVFKMGNKDEVTTEGAFVFKLIANADQKVIGFVTPQGQKIEINDQEGAEAITLSHLSGSLVEMNPDGNVTLTDKDGAKVELAAGVVTATDSGGGTLKLAEGKVALGGSAAELVEETAKIAEAAGKAAGDLVIAAPTLVNTAVGPGALGPGGKAALQALQTAMQLVKTNLDAIKGTI